MRSKKRNTNLKILQSQLQHLATSSSEPIKTPQKVEIKGAGVELPTIDKLPKKRGIKPDELINTKRLLTM